MRRFSHILGLSILLQILICNPSFAQYDDLEFDHITGADGLPDNVINDIVQDYLGFIWIGTTSGLVKLPGENTHFIKVLQLEVHKH